MPTHSFDIEHLREIIQQLEAAKLALDKQGAWHNTPSSSQPPLIHQPSERDSALLATLKGALSDVASSFGQPLLTLGLQAYNDRKITEAQKEWLSELGDRLSRQLLQKLYSGELNLEQSFHYFIESLTALETFLDENPTVAQALGQPFIHSIDGLKTFVAKTQGLLKPETTYPKEVDESLKRLNDEADRIKDKAVNYIQDQTIGRVTDSIKNMIQEAPVVKVLTQELLAGLFPFGGTLIKVAYSLYQSDLLKDEQRDQLMEMGLNVLKIPLQLVKKEIDLNGALNSLTDTVQELGQFFLNNPDIAIRAGVLILPSLIPMGGLLQHALQEIGKSEITEELAREGVRMGADLLSNSLSRLSETTVNLQDIFQNSPFKLGL